VGGCSTITDIGSRTNNQSSDKVISSAEDFDLLARMHVCALGGRIDQASREVGSGSRCEELNVSKSRPL
jgi:hypothetical protein